MDRPQQSKIVGVKPIMPKKTVGRGKSSLTKHPFIKEVDRRFAEAEGYRSRAMFGGFGLYLGDAFFAVVDQARIYFRVTDETRPDYESAGSKPFEPWPGHVMSGYYEVPPAVWADDVLLMEWSRRAATREKAPKKGRPRKSNSKTQRRP
jgi:DNA transformation protein